MAYHHSTSFHGVSKIVVGPVKSFTRDGGRPWQCATVSLYDADGEFVESFPVHSDDNQLLTVECARVEEMAAA